MYLVAPIFFRILRVLRVFYSATLILKSVSVFRLMYSSVLIKHSLRNLVSLYLIILVTYLLLGIRLFPKTEEVENELSFNSIINGFKTVVHLSMDHWDKVFKNLSNRACNVYSDMICSATVMFHVCIYIFSFTAVTWIFYTNFCFLLVLEILLFDDTNFE